MKLPDPILREFFLCKPEEQIQTAGMSVIVPIHGAGRIKQLDNCIAWAYNQTLQPIEVIVIEDGPVQLVDDAKLREKYQTLRYHYIKNDDAFCKCACFNAGASMAIYPYMCGLDADILVPTEFLMYGFLELQRNDACFLADDIFFIEDEMDDMFDFRFTGKTWQAHRAQWQFHGGVFFIRRQKYFDIGGHDEYFKGYGSEDSEFYKRVHDTLKTSKSTHNIVHRNHDREPSSFVNEEKNKLYLYYVQAIKMSLRIANLRATNKHLDGPLLNKSTTNIIDALPVKPTVSEMDRLQRLIQLQSSRPPRKKDPIDQNEKRRRRVLGLS